MIWSVGARCEMNDHTYLRLVKDRRNPNGGLAPAAPVVWLVAMHKIIARVVKPAWQEELSIAQRQASRRCALALLGGQFADLRSALADPEFQDVSIRMVTETLESLRQDQYAKHAAEQMELDRRQKQIRPFADPKIFRPSDLFC